MPLAAGSRLDSFEIVAPLGAGGMGEVYRARDTVLKRDVAIKVLPEYWSRDPERLHRFEQEAQAAAALNHPNIVSIFHVGQFEGSPYIVTELLHGETLRERLRHGPMRLREAIDASGDIARGLAAAHDAGITHRDLKPENIFVTKDGRVKILDFGLAKLNPAKSPSSDGPTASFQQQTSPGHVLGTVGYMSPEQVRGQPADARSDIFAAGAVLYEMLTGKPAFRKATSAETMSAILNEDPTAVSQVTPSVPPGLHRIVNRCLSKNPEQRIQHATDLAFALEALSDSSSGGMAGVEKQTSAKRWIWIAGAMAAIAIAATMFVWWRVPPAVPVVATVTQLTDDGQPKFSGSLVTDGSRIYFNEGIPGSKKIMQVSTAGGETSVVPTRLTDPQTESIAPDASSLMVFDGEGNLNPLWIVPLPTGEPRRLGTIQGQDGSFFPDGRVVFAQGRDLYVAEKDGSNVRKLVTAGDSTYCPRVSPDGGTIVFRMDVAKDQSYLAEVAANGSAFHEVMRAARGWLGCAYWTPDGNYLVTRIGGDVRLLPRKAGVFEKLHNPIQVTSGPLFYSSLCPSRDGTRIFAIGSKWRGELVRYDVRSKQFVPLLSGISATDPSFSRDGRWVAYVSYPDRTLWRSRTDGTDRLQLTYQPTRATYPFISPDGTKVAFATGEEKFYVMNIDGTSVQELPRQGILMPNWSPDGNTLIYAAPIEGKHLSGKEKNLFQLETLDLRSGNRSVVASSQGLYGALWTASNTIVAVTEDQTKLVMLDLNSGKSTELVSGMIVDRAASLDQRYVYYTTGGAEQKAMRVRLADRKVEEIANLKDIRRVAYASMSVAPDGSAVLSRDIGSQEIYALTIKWP